MAQVWISKNERPFELYDLVDTRSDYQQAVRDYLPHTDTVFDRCHAVKNYSKAPGNRRRIEFGKASSQVKSDSKNPII